MPVMSREADLALPSIPFWLLNALLLCSAYWVAVALLSPELMVEVLQIPTSGWRGIALGLAPFAACLILAVRGRVARRAGPWLALICLAALINLVTFVAVGVLTEEGVETPPPISILA